MLEINQSALSIQLQRTDSQIYFLGNDESYLSATMNPIFRQRLKCHRRVLSSQKVCKDCQRCGFDLIFLQLANRQRTQSPADAIGNPNFGNAGRVRVAGVPAHVPTPGRSLQSLPESLSREPELPEHEEAHSQLLHVSKSQSVR